MEWKYNNTKSSLLQSFKSEEDYLETDRKYTKISHNFLHFKPHTFPIWPKIRKCIGMQIFWNWRGWTAVKYADAHSDLVQCVPMYITLYLNMSFNTNLGTHRCPKLLIVTLHRLPALCRFYRKTIFLLSKSLFTKLRILKLN